MGARIQSTTDKYRQSGGASEMYSDFLHTFIPHPNTGQITRKTNVDSVKMSLRNLLFTNKYERRKNPEFGTNLRRFLFEPFGINTEREIKTEIEYAVDRFEPRVRIEDVFVNSDEDANAIAIRIIFIVIESEAKQQLDLTFYRVR